MDTLKILVTHIHVISAGLIVAGYDHRKGGEIYNIPPGGSLHKAPYAIGGSGSTYIYGYCDSNWKDGMNEEEALAFVKGALGQAIKWDGSSGGVIRMVVLTAVCSPPLYTTTFRLIGKLILPERSKETYFLP